MSSPPASKPQGKRNLAHQAGADVLPRAKPVARVGKAAGLKPQAPRVLEARTASTQWGAPTEPAQLSFQFSRFGR